MLNSLLIKIPADHFEERSYSINFILNELLGIHFYLEISHNTNDYIIEFANICIIIKDAFFSFHLKSNYLNANNIPNTVFLSANEFACSENIPIIFGTNDIHYENSQLICKLDIFASAFFMLTRWEEMVNPIRDAHDRFPGEESIAFKNNFLSRPIVNEYAELLWNMLVACGFNGKRKKRDLKLYLTHDIDHLFTSVTTRQIAADLYKRFDAPLAYRHFRYKYTDNPYDQYDFLMDCSERMNVPSRFYFKASSLITCYDQDNYLKTGKFRRIIRNIKARGHLIGFHPGYDTYLDESKWAREKNLLEEATQTDLLEGRQHYLRMQVPTTLRIWENNGMETDSTLGYADRNGFRCGTGDEFPVFDLLSRRVMKLKERPLVVMDGTLKLNTANSPEKSLEIVRDYLQTGRKFRMGITLLFHNSSFDQENWPGWKRMYRNLTNESQEGS